MRQSTKKITIIAIVTSMLMLVLVGLPIASVLRNYLQVAVIISAILASVITMDWAKTRTRNNAKLTATLVILFAIVFQIAIYLLLGMKLGFARNIYGWNLTSICGVFLPLTLIIITEEILRGQLVERGRGSMAAVTVTGIAIWLIIVMVAVPNYNLAEPKAIFTLLTVVAGPAIFTNILATYIAYTYDYRINIAYRIIMDLPLVILPVIPDAGSFLPALFQIGTTAIIVLTLVGLKTTSGQKLMLIATNRKKHTKRMESDGTKRVKRIAKWISVSVVASLVVVYVALMSGLFKYYFLAVGSGSMEPNLYRGDMVLVEKSKEYEDMTVGDVLVYHYKDIIMVHRIAEINTDNDKYVFQTKGDNNASIDSWIVEQSDIIGLARGKIAMFGFPTLWLHELFTK